MVTRETILEHLAKVAGPDGKTPLPQSGALSEIVVQDGKVYFSIAIDPARSMELEPMRRAAEAAAASVPGVSQAIVTLTSDRPAGRAGFRVPGGAGTLARWSWVRRSGSPTPNGGVPVASS